MTYSATFCNIGCTDARSDFAEDDMPLLHFYAENYSDSHPNMFTVNPPNHVICLLNWELVAALLTKVGHTRYNRFRRSHRRLTSTGLNVVVGDDEENVEPLFLIDSHLHLDMIMKKGRFTDYEHLERVVTEFIPSSTLYFGVCNYVFPAHWDD